jgi:hypothetical protein
MQQLGFELDYTDPFTQEMVNWGTYTEEMVSRIKGAAWKVVDVETTGLNPSSKEQNFVGRDIRAGVDAKLRMRILSILYPLMGTAKGVDIQSFDFDEMTREERSSLAGASLTNVVIAHNAGFDVYWLRLHSQVVPALLLDTMLIARELYAEQPLVLARMCADEDEDFELREAAIKTMVQGRSGWSLADLCLTKLRFLMDKGLQGPKNWCKPFLTQADYNYATDDVRYTYELLLCFLGLDGQERAPTELLKRYYERREAVPSLKLIEPQVWDVVLMREHGMPWNKEEAEAYVASQWVKVKAFADELVVIEPALTKYLKTLGDAEDGVSADLKQAMGEAFTARGLEVATTDKAGTFKIGEKDLRRAKAQLSPDAMVLFNCWVGLNRAKKAGNMARDVTGFSNRSEDGRLHPNTGHGPATGRLSASEPNCQQFPRDQGFRNGVRAKSGHKIVASDYSALDMRAGAALAIRAQREIFDTYMGDREVSSEVLTCISNVIEGKVTALAARVREVKLEADFAAWKERREKVPNDNAARKSYWDRYRRMQRMALLARFTRCYAEVTERALAAKTADWGSLRDAFDITGMDIHTWTALGMRGQDPKALFTGLDGESVVRELKAWKKEIGDGRQTGKVGNLSLLYAMQTHGLIDAAAKNYNIHWSYEVGNKVRQDWLAAYVEIDLWHAWTELNPHEQMYMPDPDKGGKFVKRAAYKAMTLGGRVIYTFGLNAALAYQDQSSGADILGLVMDTFRREHRLVFDTIVNQVHDEIVFEVPNEHVEGYTNLIGDVMNACGNQLLMPYGVQCECSPAVGDVWVKD